MTKVSNILKGFSIARERSDRSNLLSLIILLSVLLSAACGGLDPVNTEDGGAVATDGGTDGGVPANDGGTDDGLYGGCSLINDGGMWTDSTSGLMWQNPPCLNAMHWQAAMEYCENLPQSGYNDWRVPTINELRSLIRGCSATEIKVDDGGYSVIDGGCRVTDSCTDDELYGTPDDPCNGCLLGAGPTMNTECGPIYWPDALDGRCAGYWSATATHYSHDAWLVRFHYADVDFNSKYWDNWVRCVR